MKLLFLIAFVYLIIEYLNYSNRKAKKPNDGITGSEATDENIEDNNNEDLLDLDCLSNNKLNNSTLDSSAKSSTKKQIVNNQAQTHQKEYITEVITKDQSSMNPMEESSLGDIHCFIDENEVPLKECDLEPEAESVQELTDNQTS